MALPHSRGSETKAISERPSRGYRMALKDYSDNEAVRSRGWNLIYPEFVVSLGHGVARRVELSRI